jgi:hypothetical protein
MGLRSAIVFIIGEKEARSCNVSRVEKNLSFTNQLMVKSASLVSFTEL